MPNGVIAHAPDGKFDIDALEREAAAFPGLVGLDLAKDVTCGQSYSWDETDVALGRRLWAARRARASMWSRSTMA